MKASHVMADVAAPAAAPVLEQDLSSMRPVRSFRGLEIFAFHAGDAPGLMHEVGRIREIAFRSEGGGTGKPLDIDDFDLDPRGFRQLVAWDPEERQIVAAYRFRRMSDDPALSPTLRLFEASPAFMTEVAPWAIELGRSVVNRGARRALRGLHAVWGGLGAMVAELSDLRFFFGKVTMFPGYNAEAKRAIFSVLRRYFPPRPDYLRVRPAFAVEALGGGAFVPTGAGFRTDWGALVDFVASQGTAVPPLFVSYTELSTTMQVFETAVNPHFGDVEETAILIHIPDIIARMRRTFVDSHEGGARELLSPRDAAKDGNG